MSKLWLWLAIVLIAIAAGAAAWYLHDQSEPDVYVRGGPGQGPIEFYTHVDDITEIPDTCRRLRAHWPSRRAEFVVVYVGSESVATNACRPPAADKEAKP